MSACIIVTPLVIAVTAKTGCGEGTKTPLSPRLRCSSHTRGSLHPYTCCGSSNRDSDARWGGERYIRHCLDPGCERQNARDRPLQHSCWIASDHGWHRGRCEHNNRCGVDSAPRVPSVFSGTGGGCATRPF